MNYLSNKENKGKSMKMKVLSDIRKIIDTME